jgi:hypothetical protein
MQHGQPLRGIESWAGFRRQTLGQPAGTLSDLVHDTLGFGVAD